MKISAIGLGEQLDKSLTKTAWPRRNSTRKGEKGLCLYSTDIALIAQSKSFNHFLYRGSFYGQWEKCRFGTVQTFTIPRTTRYLIKAWGAQGETLSYDYGDYPGTYYGGKGVFKEGKFRLNKGTVLNIVVG